MEVKTSSKVDDSMGKVFAVQAEPPKFGAQIPSRVWLCTFLTPVLGSNTNWSESFLLASLNKLELKDQ